MYIENDNSYATHLLEGGTDMVFIQKLLEIYFFILGNLFYLCSQKL